jgi:hypothetical protein
MLLFAQLQTGTLVLLTGVGLTVAVLLVRSQRGPRRQPGQPPNRPQAQRPHASHPQRPTLQQAVQPIPRRAPSADPIREEVDPQASARGALADLDRKLHDLQQVIRAGEALAVRLEGLLERAGNATTPSSQLPFADSPRATPARSLVHPGTQAAALASVARGSSTRTADLQQSGTARAATMTDRDEVATGPVSSGTAAEPLRRFDEIYALANAGCDSATIAGITGSPVGEVELILSLRANGSC